ncbi:PREDICTED: uncharacterized protein LOC107880097 [Prunus mume]|uniref:Uncharacterized protein LOC107880097 n=1 Tax=Prunus mume TaxID=102107 RepID=A0ABM1LSQ5_PRUMU|nr:PREDICTED: uncharacterized protein LOC107880097 [Prunus mume]
MRSNAKKQSKLMYIICAPIRTLTKARNFYMRSLEDCASKVGYGGGGVSGYTASQVPRLPKSFSVNSSSSSDDEDLRQLLRTASSKNSKRNDVEKKNNNKPAGDLDVHKRPVVRQAAQPIAGQQTMNGMGMRSYSVGLKMRRIDEERACSFEEDEVNVVKADLYPRSRSYAVKRRSGGFA